MTKLIRGCLDRIDMFQRKEQYELRVALLRKAGCNCERPLLGWRPQVGPRCRLCNTVAEVKDVD